MYIFNSTSTQYFDTCLPTTLCNHCFLMDLSLRLFPRFTVKLKYRTASEYAAGNSRSPRVIGKRPYSIQTFRVVDYSSGFNTTINNTSGRRRLPSARGSNQSFSSKDASVEKSNLVNEELLLFFFQLDLSMRLQKSLNLEQYDAAKLIREKISEVELELSKQREERIGASSKEEAQDVGLTMLRLKSDLQKAISEERYSEAAHLRDCVAKMEAESLAVSLKGLTARNVVYEYRLGQKIVHSVFGYRGVVCGMDPICCESMEWVEAAEVDQLSMGRNQPFYQVLIDVQETKGFLVAYVAQQRISLPVEPDKKLFSHPYTYLLFYGMDSNGDFIPTKQLRERYNAPRYEASPGDDLDEGKSDSD